jgi:hypothetical protein
MVFNLLRGPAGYTLGAPNTAGGSWAPTTLTATVDGSAATLTQVDAITTRSGTWWVDSLGQHGDSHVYAMRFSGNSAFIRLLVMRRVFTTEAGDGTSLDTRTIALAATLNGTAHTWTAGCVQGSIRVVQNQDPIAPNPTWIREAVTNYKLVAYKRENSIYPTNFVPVTTDSWRGAYDPTSLGPNSAATTPSSSDNYVGTTSGSGGEFYASRGFIHNIDCGLIDRALHNEDGAITTLWPQFVQYTFYSLAQPQAANWSTTNHQTADPFFPISSPDRPYEMGGVAGTPDPAIDSIQPVTNWSRDPSHLENTGYVHWLATEDPVAALVVQRQLAYVIASYYEYRRTSVTTNYRCFDEQIRGIYNGFSALFKNKIITDSVTSLNGKWLWSSTRVNKMVADCISYLDGWVYTPINTATAADPVKYTQKITSNYDLTYDNLINAWGGPIDGQSVKVVSTFMTYGYGQEPLYLWTKNGNTTMTKWFTAVATYFSNLMQYVGGSAALDQANTTQGSGRPVILNSATTPFTSVSDWATWLKTINPRAQTTSFNGYLPNTAGIYTTYASYSHQVNRFGNTLLLAKDAGVAGLDPAIATFNSCKAATNYAVGQINGQESPSSYFGNWAKNSGGLQ